MNRIESDDSVMITTEEQDLISHEKAFVRLEAGCLWTYLLENGTRVGIAFLGPSRFAVDAIAETKLGAMGESIKGALVGMQLYVGTSSLESISRSADVTDLQNRGFDDAKMFAEEVKSTIKARINGDHGKIRLDSKEQSELLFGLDSSETKLLLVLNRKNNLVFTYGKQVFVLNDDNVVSVNKSGVVISGEDGKQIVVGKDGIYGPDGPLDIGPIVTESVTEAMKGLKGLKSLKSMKKTMREFPYVNVDDFDWDD